jgi:hypothetical protein
VGGSRSTHGGDEKCIQNFVGKAEVRKPLEDIGIDGKIILEWILENQGGKVWAGLIWIRIETSGGLL